MQFCEKGFPFVAERLKQLVFEDTVTNKRKGFSSVKKIAGRFPSTKL